MDRQGTTRSDITIQVVRMTGLDSHISIGKDFTIGIVQRIFFFTGCGNGQVFFRSNGLVIGDLVGSDCHISNASHDFIIGDLSIGLQPHMSRRSHGSCILYSLRMDGHVFRAVGSAGMV